MAYQPYERLSAVDATFLEIEDAHVHMHVGAVGVFEAAPLRREDGAIDIERIRRFTESALDQTPRFRQKLAWIPVLGHPVWADDARFNLNYHVRHTALPPPGDVRQLKRLAGRIFSQKLDRGKPMWEMWVVDGLQGDRFGLVLKAHHCMVDGIAGVDLLAALLRLDPEATEQPDAPRWIPQPQPSSARLLGDELWRRASLPFTLLGRAPQAIAHPVETIDSVRESVAAVAETIQAGLRPTTATPLNPEIGPYRRFDWTQTEIARVKEIRKHLGGTLNDVVLSTVAGAVRGFLARRGMRVSRDTVFRVMVPVSIRTGDERGVPGNRVVNFLARLPVDESDPRARLERTHETTETLKGSRLVRGAEVIEEIGDHTFTSLVVEFVRLAANQRSFNLVVTNVPGPPRPVYLLGAKLTEIYPLVPLFTNQGLGIALFSYDGKLFWGFNADWDALPDLHDFADSIDAEFEALYEAAANPTTMS